MMKITRYTIHSHDIKSKDWCIIKDVNWEINYKNKTGNCTEIWSYLQNRFPEHRPSSFCFQIITF